MEQARWYAVRRAQNHKPATYRCPLCGQHLPALIEHMLIVPEGDSSRRRHAHSECVMRARKAGRLPTREEYSRDRRREARGESDARAGGGPLGRLIDRLTGRASK